MKRERAIPVTPRHTPVRNRISDQTRVRQARRKCAKRDASAPSETATRQVTSALSASAPARPGRHQAEEPRSHALPTASLCLKRATVPRPSLNELTCAGPNKYMGPRAMVVLRLNIIIHPATQACIPSIRTAKNFCNTAKKTRQRYPFCSFFQHSQSANLQVARQSFTHCQTMQRQATS